MIALRNNYTNSVLKVWVVVRLIATILLFIATIYAVCFLAFATTMYFNEQEELERFIQFHLLNSMLIISTIVLLQLWDIYLAVQTVKAVNNISNLVENTEIPADELDIEADKRVTLQPEIHP